tara:strand:- start:1433 stop:2680 length:1248 start_codon:yes stop_codon:yes gene_type:complete
MSFTKTSEILIKNFKSEIGKINVKISEKGKKRTNTIFKSLHQTIKHSKNYIATLDYNNLLRTSLIDLTNKKLPNNVLMNSQYVPEIIKESILRMKGYMKTKVTIDNIEVSIHFGMFLKSDLNDLNKIKKQIIEALNIVKFCTSYANSKSVKTLDIYLYLTNHKKLMPKKTIDVLSPINCNSAVTFACSQNGKLLIYRKEEWKKVLIHELFHSLCLDFATINYDNLRNNVKSLFKIESDYELSESYSEFWAVIVNACFVSYDLLDDINNIKDFLLYVKFCLNLEIIFSLFQMIKMLSHMNMNYDMLYKNDKTSKYAKILYKENTNVFCYYIIKTIMLFFYDDFFKWCNLNNSNILKFDKRGVNLVRFYNFIEKKYKSEYFIESIHKMETFFLKKMNSDSKISLILKKTGRMSICEN